MSKTYSILLVIISLVLFIGGIFILALKIPFWSLLLGLPTVWVGIVLLIFTFDKLSQEAIEEKLEALKSGRLN